jgi:hypothetical protein
MLSSSAYHNPA